MKVYSLPDDCPAPATDFANYDMAKEDAKEAEHKERLKGWLIAQGYKGKLTGEEFRVGHADGYARYMVGEKGGAMILIHLPYGDAWNSPHVARMTQADIREGVERGQRLAAMFASRKA